MDAGCPIRGCQAGVSPPRLARKGRSTRKKVVRIANTSRCEHVERCSAQEASGEKASAGGTEGKAPALTFMTGRRTWAHDRRHRSACASVGTAARGRACSESGTKDAFRIRMASSSISARWIICSRTSSGRAPSIHRERGRAWPFRCAWLHGASGASTRSRADPPPRMLGRACTGFLSLPPPAARVRTRAAGFLFW